MKGEAILLDSSVLVHGLAGTMPWCSALVEDCIVGKKTGILTAVVVGETTHRLMALEARRKTLAGANPAKTLAKNPSRVRKLGEYRTLIRDIFSCRLRFEPHIAADYLTALEIQARDGLMANDSLLAATALRLDVSWLATCDKGFDGVKGLKIVSS